MSLATCAECLTALGATPTACAACFTLGEELAGLPCAECAAELGALVAGCVECAAYSITQIINYFRGGKMPTPACNTTHSTRTAGAGTCCTAVQQGLITPPPKGTVLPPYVAGDLANGRIPTNRYASVTAAGTHDGCGTCMIVGSSSAKHRGRPVLKFVRGGPGCPSSITGCCAMAA